MRYVESRAQWEHTSEEEQLRGWSHTVNADMPPSLIKMLDEREGLLVRQADKLQDARARLEKAEELLRDGTRGCNCPGDCSHVADFEARVTAFLAAQPVPGEPGKGG